MNTITSTHINTYANDGCIHLHGLLTKDTVVSWHSQFARQWPSSTQKQEICQNATPTERPSFRQSISGVMTRTSETLSSIPHWPKQQHANASRWCALYHDQALLGSWRGHTPWHCDQVYWPLSSEKTVTAWIPLVPVTKNMGPLALLGAKPDSVP